MLQYAKLGGGEKMTSGKSIQHKLVGDLDLKHLLTILNGTALIKECK